MPPDGPAGVRWTQPPPLTPEARRWAICWVTALGVGGCVDYWRATHHDGSTVSELVRSLFDTSTPQGRARFLAVLATGTTVFALHILN